MRALAFAWLVIFYPAIVAGIFLGLIVFALSAATPAAPGAFRTPTSTDASGVAAVRANASPNPSPSEDPSPASEESTSVEVSRPPRITTQVTLPRDDPATVLAIITNAAVEFAQDPAAMISVARCESTLNPLAVGDGGDAVGLWQFHLPTWTANARRLFHRDVGDLRTDAVSTSLVAAWMFSIGQSGQWTCAKGDGQ